MMGHADSARALALQAHDIAAVDSLTELRSARVGEADLVEGRAMLASGDTAAARKTLREALVALEYGAGPDFARTREAKTLLQSLGVVVSSS